MSLAGNVGMGEACVHRWCVSSVGYSPLVLLHGPARHTSWAGQNVPVTGTMPLQAGKEGALNHPGTSPRRGLPTRPRCPHRRHRVSPLGTSCRTGWALHCLRSSLLRFTVFTDRWSRMLNKNTPDIQDQRSELLKSQAKQFSSDVNWFRKMECKQTWEACWGLGTLTQQGMCIYART